MSSSLHRRRFIATAGAFLLAISTACAISPAPDERPAPAAPRGDDADDRFTEAELVALGQVPTVRIDAAHVVLPNGEKLAAFASDHPSVAGGVSTSSLHLLGGVGATGSDVGPQERKAMIVATMVSTAISLTASGSKPGEGDGAPAQPNGLAYVYGGKDPARRTSPVDSCGVERLYGVDCSGLVYQAARAAALSIPSGPASTQAQAGTWESKIPKEWGVKVKPAPPGSAPETGDIIFYPAHGHIGVVAQMDDGELYVISSLGGPDRCDANKDENHGPRARSVERMASAMGDGGVRLRFVATLSGDWDFHLRCAGQTTDAAVVRIKLDNENGGPFDVRGSGTDYDGSPLSIAMSGSYDQVKNVLAGVMKTADREDAFTVKLDHDTTGYFSLTKKVDNRGCPASGQLVRITTTQGR